jgi:cysteine desulfuration protein SufE
MRTVAANQAALLELYGPIEDPQERLTLVVEAARTAPTMPPAERTADLLVEGCTSRVWLKSEYAAGVLRFASASDSPLVHGLVALLCATYADCAPADVAATEPTILHDLALWRNLSPTRQRGLTAVRTRLRTLALPCLPDSQQVT